MMPPTKTSALPVLPRNPCRNCSRCCRAYLVPLNGQDIWRIWRSQRLSPDKFVLPVEVPNDRPDAFRLSADGDRLMLILDKKGKLRPTAPCIFLMELHGSHDRCGIYGDRPAACRAYPMIQAPNRIAVNPKALCPPDSWNEDDTAKDSWQVVVREADLQYDVYSLVVAHWNEHVARYSDRQFDIDEFFGYLYNVYERVAALDALVTADEHRAIQASWGHAAAGNDALASRPWITYVEQIQQIVETFYPVVNLSVTAD